MNPKMGNLGAGYLHPDYPCSLSEFGEARRLSQSGGWLLVREIAGSSARDAMSWLGSYLRWYLLGIRGSLFKRRAV